ncbi:MAG: polysulfide reductase NrfD [Nitrosomonadales bacterium]|nr:polysulfide reductase NrfD [Nitrosomonadales bacterium]
MSTQQMKGPVNAAMMAGMAALVIGGGLALVNLMSSGHAAFNTGSSGITWGLPVVGYVFFVLTSTGLTFVASLAMVFGIKEFYPIAKRCIWLALVTLVAGFTCLALELGHPFRMLWAIPTSFQYLSPLNWMGLFYAAYMVLLLLKFQKVNGGDWDSSGSRTLGIASFVSVVIAHGTLGGVFGAMAMRPMWYGPIIPLYFLLTAAVSGAAFAVLITYLTYGNESFMPAKVKNLMKGAMPKVFAAVLGIVILAVVSRTMIGLWSNADGLQVWDHVVASPWYWIELILMVAAFFMLLNGGSPFFPSIMVIISLFIGRYEFLISGQAVPLFKGTWVTGLIDYMPSVTEWMIVLLAVGIVLAGWAFGEKSLNLAAEPAEK